MKVLVAPRVIVHLGLPLLILISSGLQLWRLGKSPITWTTLAAGVAWAIWNATNFMHVTYLPYPFIGDFQQPYWIIRGVAVLVYAAVAITSAIQKSKPMQTVSVVSQRIDASYGPT